MGEGGLQLDRNIESYIWYVSHFWEGGIIVRQIYRKLYLVCFRFVASYIATQAAASSIEKAKFLVMAGF